MEYVLGAIHEVACQLVTAFLNAQLLISKYYVVIVISSACLSSLQLEDLHLLIIKTKQEGLRLFLFWLQWESIWSKASNNSVACSFAEKQYVLFVVYSAMEVFSLVKRMIIQWAHWSDLAYNGVEFLLETGCYFLVHLKLLNDAVCIYKDLFGRLLFDHSAFFELVLQGIHFEL